MDINDKNELQTHQGMDSRHLQKVNSSDKNSIWRTLYSVKTLLSMIDLHAMLTKYTST